MDNAHIPEKLFYSGNERLISGTALQNLAEHLSNYRCMNYIRRAFADILAGLDMSDRDRAYYRLLAGESDDDVIQEETA
jgi:hypothetical protein